jgi:glutathione S-transferase
MKLWSGTLSPFSTKVRIALAEKGLCAEIAEIPWSRARLWGPKPKAFLDVSPKAEVPVLEDGGLAIVDSTVINEYLEEAYPDTPLMPTEPLARAECRMWEDMADHYMAAHLTALIREMFMKPEAERDAALVAATLEAYGGYLGALERRLAGREYLCDAFSVADIASWIGLAFAQTLGVDVGDRPALRAWYGRMGERPTVRAEFEQIMAAAAAA